MSSDPALPGQVRKLFLARRLFIEPRWASIGRVPERALVLILSEEMQFEDCGTYLVLTDEGRVGWIARVRGNAIFYGDM